MMRQQSIRLRHTDFEVKSACAHVSTAPAGAARGSATVVRLQPAMTTEQRLIRAYLRLYIVTPDEDGVKRVAVARFGSYELRLFEPAQEVALDTMPLWMELYDHNRGEIVDSFGSDELEAAVAAADELMRVGRQLSQASGHLTLVQG